MRRRGRVRGVYQLGSKSGRGKVEGGREGEREEWKARTERGVYLSLLLL